MTALFPTPLVEDFAFCPPPLRRWLGGGYFILMHISEVSKILILVILKCVARSISKSKNVSRNISRSRAQYDNKRDASFSAKSHYDGKHSVIVSNDSTSAIADNDSASVIASKCDFVKSSVCVAIYFISFVKILFFGVLYR